MRPSESEHETALSRVVDYAEEANLGPVEPERDEETDDHEFVDYVRINGRENDTVYVTAPLGDRQFEMIYPYDFIQTISNSLNEADVDELGPEETEDNDNSSYEAAIRLLRQTPEDKLETLRGSLHIIGASEAVTIFARSDHNLSLSGYNQQTYIYPFDDQFSYQSFFDSYVSLVNMVKRTREWIRRNIQVARPEETDTDQHQLLIE